MIPIRLEVYLKRHKNVMLDVQSDAYMDWFHSELSDVELGKQLFVGHGKCMEDAIIDVTNKIPVDEI